MPRVQVFVRDASGDGARLDAYSLKLDGTEIWSQSIPSLEPRHQRDICSLLGEAVLAAVRAARGPGRPCIAVPTPGGMEKHYTDEGPCCSGEAATRHPGAPGGVSSPGTAHEPTEGASSILSPPEPPVGGQAT